MNQESASGIRWWEVGVKIKQNKRHGEQWGLLFYKGYQGYLRRYLHAYHLKISLGSTHT